MYPNPTQRHPAAKPRIRSGFGRPCKDVDVEFHQQTLTGNRRL